MTRFFAALGAALLGALALLAPVDARAQLVITITNPNIEPLPFAIAPFQVETGGRRDAGAPTSPGVVAADLDGTGLFREIPRDAYISTPVASFGEAPLFPDWQAINAQALITGAVAVPGDQLHVQVPALRRLLGRRAGRGAAVRGHRQRLAADGRTRSPTRSIRGITGEGGYFDSRVVFVAESGPKDNRLQAARPSWTTTAPTCST